MVSKEKFKVLLLEPSDNVAVALVDIPVATVITLPGGGRPNLQLQTTEPIAQGHKVAVSDIAKGGWIIKYGERIGISKADIKVGAHVHIHNVADITETLVSERRPV